MLDYIKKIDDCIRAVGKKKTKITVLEAGCGSSSRFDFGKNAYITGVDISFDELKKNTSVHRKIQGDIQEMQFKHSSFDVVVCWEVLEHIRNPRFVMDNLARSLKKEGIFIIGIPNVLSVKGLITRITPYRFHVWCNRCIFRWQSIPFPTFMNIMISPPYLRRLTKDLQLAIEWSHFNKVWIDKLRNRSLLAYAIYLGLGIIVKIVTLGTVSFTKTDYIVIFRKY